MFGGSVGASTQEMHVALPCANYVQVSLPRKVITSNTTCDCHGHMAHRVVRGQVTPKSKDAVSKSVQFLDTMGKPWH